MGADGTEIRTTSNLLFNTILMLTIIGVVLSLTYLGTTALNSGVNKASEKTASSDLKYLEELSDQCEAGDYVSVPVISAALSRLTKDDLSYIIVADGSSKNTLYTSISLDATTTAPYTVDKSDTMISDITRALNVNASYNCIFKLISTNNNGLRVSGAYIEIVR